MYTAQTEKRLLPDFVVATVPLVAYKRDVQDDNWAAIRRQLLDTLRESCADVLDREIATRNW